MTTTLRHVLLTTLPVLDKNVQNSAPVAVTMLEQQDVQNLAVVAVTMLAQHQAQQLALT